MRATITSTSALSFTSSVLFLALTILVGPAADRSHADDWTFFRGPHLNGTSDEADWSAIYPETGPRIAWEKAVGNGASSVVVAGNRVVTMGNRAGKDVVACLSADDGEVLWEFAYDCAFEARMFDGGTASTPTIDGDRVYTLSYRGHIFCLGLADGKEIWKAHANDSGGSPPRWKYAGSPLVDGDLVIFDIGGKDASTLALDKKTGKRAWAAGADPPGYASPIPYTYNGQRAVLVFKSRAMISVEAASGKELWRLPWRSAYDVNASTPIVLDDRVLISSGYPGGRAAMFQLTDGDPRRLWRNDDIKTKMSSLAVHAGHAYGISERGGRLLCISLETGKNVWEQKGFGRFGTLMIAGDKLVILTDSGELVIADASSRAYIEHARASVLRGTCWVNPVLANGRIYCRNNIGTLRCVDVRSAAGE
jgi:outer membrane protein assembly factor BamB